MMSVCKLAIATLEMRLQLVTSRYTIFVSVDGTDEIFVDATFSVESVVEYVAGTCVMLAQPVMSR